MNEFTFQLTSLILAFISIVLLPILVFIIRGAMKWSQVETKLDEVVSDVKELVVNKDKVHDLIMEQIKEERKATDRRLRWLEEYLWKRGDKNAL